MRLLGRECGRGPCHWKELGNESGRVGSTGRELRRWGVRKGDMGG